MSVCGSRPTSFAPVTTLLSLNTMSNDAPAFVSRTFSTTWLFVTMYPRCASMTKPEPLDWAWPLGRRLMTVTTLGSSSFTTSTTTSFDGPGTTLTGRALGIAPPAPTSPSGAPLRLATYPPTAPPPTAPTISPSARRSAPPMPAPPRALARDPCIAAPRSDHADGPAASCGGASSAVARALDSADAGSAGGGDSDGGIGSWSGPLISVLPDATAVVSAGHDRRCGALAAGGRLGELRLDELADGRGAKLEVDVGVGLDRDRPRAGDLRLLVDPFEAFLRIRDRVDRPHADLGRRLDGEGDVEVPALRVHRDVGDAACVER